jgi:hypothetical protein
MKATISGTSKNRGIKRNQLPFLLGLFVLLLNPTMFSLAQQDGISIGDIVEVTSGQGLRLRTEPGLDTPVIVTLPYKTQMKVVGGPRTNIAGFNWWELEGMQMRGWAVENYLKVVSGTEIGPSASNAPGCEQPYPAIQYCPEKERPIYSILIDLDNPHIRVETIMANDTKSVNTGNREFVSRMGDRRKADGAVVVINADYFGNGHGPEGFTVVNGERLDGLDKGDDDLGAVYRSSIAFSKSKLDGGESPIQMDIQRFTEDRFHLDTNKMFNAIGGGPQIVSMGTWHWTRGRQESADSNYPACPTKVADNNVINAECFVDTGNTGTGWEDPTKTWTVVGMTADGHLFILLAPYPNVRSALETNQVQEAIKLDGGGSSQLWFNGQAIVPGDGRQVANGLAVFYKADYEIVEPPPQLPVVVSGERLGINMTLKNMGADTWTQKDYGISVIKSPWDMNLQAQLPHDVKPGETVTLTWQSPPIDQAWNFYSFDLQLVDHGNEFPMEPISVRAIVIPQSLAEKKEELEKEIREWVEKGVDDIEQAITEWIKRQLMSAWERLIYDLTHCNLSLAVLIVMALFVYRRAHL